MLSRANSSADLLRDTTSKPASSGKQRFARIWRLLRLGLFLNVLLPVICLILNSAAWIFVLKSLKMHHVVDGFASYGYQASPSQQKPQDWIMEVTSMIYVPASKGNFIKQSFIKYTGVILRLFMTFDDAIMKERLSIFNKDYKRGKMVSYEICTYRSIVEDSFGMVHMDGWKDVPRRNLSCVDHKDVYGPSSEGGVISASVPFSNRFKYDSFTNNKVLVRVKRDDLEGQARDMKKKGPFSAIRRIFGGSSSTTNNNSSSSSRISKNNSSHSSDDETSLSRESGAEGDRPSIVHLVPFHGVSVISDIDDTIKITDVGNIPEVLSNTLLRAFKPVPHMSYYYQNWVREALFKKKMALNIHFHYVSSSPVALAGTLYDWITSPSQGNYPSGSMHLKNFRLELFEPWGLDLSMFNIIRNPTQYKIEKITTIIKNFPGRSFILVGDSSEKDPEIYGSVMRGPYGSQIICTMIRNVTNRPILLDRLRIVFRGLDSRRFVAFGGSIGGQERYVEMPTLDNMVKNQHCSM